MELVLQIMAGVVGGVAVAFAGGALICRISDAISNYRHTKYMNSPELLAKEAAHNKRMLDDTIKRLETRLKTSESSVDRLRDTLRNEIALRVEASAEQLRTRMDREFERYEMTADSVVDKLDRIIDRLSALEDGETVDPDDLDSQLSELFDRVTSLEDKVEDGTDLEDRIEDANSVAEEARNAAEDAMEKASNVSDTVEALEERLEAEKEDLEDTIFGVGERISTLERKKKR